MVMGTKDGERLTYSVDELAKKLGISRMNAYRQCNEGRVPGVVRCGRRLLIGRAAIDAWLAGQCETAPGVGSAEGR